MDSFYENQPLPSQDSVKTSTKGSVDHESDFLSALSSPFHTENFSAATGDGVAVGGPNVLGDQQPLWQVSPRDADDSQTIEPYHLMRQHRHAPLEPHNGAVWAPTPLALSWSTNAGTFQQPTPFHKTTHSGELAHQDFLTPTVDTYNFSDTAFWEARMEAEADGFLVSVSRRELLIGQPSLQDEILRDYGMFCLKKPFDDPNPNPGNHPAQHSTQAQMSPEDSSNTTSETAMTEVDGAISQAASVIPFKTDDHLSGRSIPVEMGNPPSGQTNGYTTLNVDDDDWQQVELDVQSLAQRFVNTLTIPYERRPAGIELEDEPEYVAKQEAAIKEIDEKPADRVVENCTKLARLVVSIHKQGVVNADYERSLVRGKRHLKILDGVKCSTRGELVEDVLRDNKRLAVSVAEGTALETIAYHPLHMMKARVDLFKSNMTRARRLKAQKQDGNAVGTDSTTEQGHGGKRKLDNAGDEQNSVTVATATTSTKNPRTKKQKTHHSE